MTEAPKKPAEDAAAPVKKVDAVAAMIAKEYTTDKSLEVEGVPVTIYLRSQEKTIEVKLARYENARFKEEWKKTVLPLLTPTGAPKPGVTEAQQTAAARSVFAKTVLLGWRVPGEGEFAWDMDTALMLLDIEDFRTEVARTCTLMELYRKQDMTEAGKS